MLTVFDTSQYKVKSTDSKLFCAIYLHSTIGIDKEMHIIDRSNNSVV